MEGRLGNYHILCRVATFMFVLRGEIVRSVTILTRLKEASWEMQSAWINYDSNINQIILRAHAIMLSTLPMLYTSRWLYTLSSEDHHKSQKKMWHTAIAAQRDTNLQTAAEDVQ